jgi:hypothetical protein
MKLYIAYISLFFIALHVVDTERDVPGTYIGTFLGEHELILKSNGKFVRKGYSLVPKQNSPFDPNPGNLPTPVGEKEKRKYKIKGTWVYFKTDTLDGIVLVINKNQSDSLFFQENGNLSNIKPQPTTVYEDTTGEKDSSAVVVVTHRYANQRVVAYEYKKIEI